MQSRPPADGLGVFLNAAGKIPLLTAAEEIELGRQVREWQDHPGGPDAAPRSLQRRGKRAKDRMITANLRLVVTVARRFSQIGARRGLDPSDLIQEGCIGLARGVEKFDPERGFKFSTYAYWWIRQGITRALSAAGTIRIPIHVNDTQSRVRKAVRELAQQGNHNPTLAQLTEATGRNKDQLRLAMEFAANVSHVASLDAQISDTDSGTLAEVLPAPEEADHLTRMEQWELAVDLRAWLPDEVALLELRAVEEARVTDIGELMGVSRTRAGQLVQEAREKLQAVAGDRGRELLAC
jgi:RNA polymerase primary sigma factor